MAEFTKDEITSVMLLQFSLFFSYLTYISFKFGDLLNRFMQDRKVLPLHWFFGRLVVFCFFLSTEESSSSFEFGKNTVMVPGHMEDEHFYCLCVMGWKERIKGGAFVDCLRWK